MENRTPYVKLVSCLIIACLFLISPVSTSFASTGVLLAVKGKVVVDLNGVTQPAKTGLKLNPGDAVTSRGGTASILFSDGRMRWVKQGASFIVPSKGSTGSGDRLALRLINTLQETVQRGRGPTIKGMVRGLREIPLVYPFNSFVLPHELRFEWAKTAAVTKIEISLKSASPRYRYTFTAMPGKKETFLPKDAPSLVSGVRYYWKVKGYETGESEPYDSKLCWFAVLGKEESAKVERETKEIDALGLPDPASQEFLKANLFISYGLHHLALGILKESLEKYPGDQGMKELLIGLLLKMKKYDEAQKLQAG